MDKATFDRLSAMEYRDIFRICREDPELDSDSPDLQFLLALCLRDGRGVRKDEETFQRVLEWCLKMGSLLAIGYQAGYEKGRQEARAEASGAAADADRVSRENAAPAESAPKKEEQPVRVLFLTRPTRKARSSETADGRDANTGGRSASGSGQADRFRSSSSHAEHAGSFMEPLYYAEGERNPGKEFSDDFSRVHQVLASHNEARIRDFLESGEFDGFLTRMPGEERREVLADLLIKINHFKTENHDELVEMCRKMALRILEGKVYIGDLQLATKNDNGEKENFPVLWFAVWLGDMILAKYLLQGGANPNLVRSCRLAGGVTLSRYALGECILRGDQRMARLLIENGANLRKMDGRKGEDGSESLTSLLAYAVLRNSAESVLLLLEKGIDPNEGYHFRDREGRWHLHSALYLAVQHTKNVYIARILLEGGANPGTAGSLANVHGEMLKALLKVY